PQDRPRHLERPPALVFLRVEVFRRQPAQKRPLQRRPFLIDGGIPRRVAAATFIDRGLTEHAFEREPQALRRRSRGRVERIALPFIAAVTERERPPHHQKLSLPGPPPAARPRGETKRADPA